MEEGSNVAERKYLKHFTGDKLYVVEPEAKAATFSNLESVATNEKKLKPRRRRRRGGVLRAHRRKANGDKLPMTLAEKEGWLLKNAKLDDRGLFHFEPFRPPRNLDVLRFLISRKFSAGSRVKIRDFYDEAVEKLVATWKTLGSGFNHEFLENRCHSNLKGRVGRLVTRYHPLTKCMRERDQAVKGKDVEKWNDFLSEIFNVYVGSGRLFWYGSAYGQPPLFSPRDQRKGPSDFGIKRARIPIPSFHDLFRVGSLPFEWCGAEFQSNESRNEDEDKNIENADDSDDAAATHRDDYEDSFSNRIDFDAENCEDGRDVKVVFDADALNDGEAEKASASDLRLTCQDSDTELNSPRDVSTQTHLIIPPDLVIPEGRNVRLKYVLEAVDS